MCDKVLNHEQFIKQVQMTYSKSNMSLWVKILRYRNCLNHDMQLKKNGKKKYIMNARVRKC